MKNYYKTLGVSEDVSESDLKKAFRKLSLETHPDKNPSPAAHEIFKDINEAYQTLSDSEKRSQYDMERKMSEQGIPQGFPPGFPQGFQFGHNGPGGIRVHHTGGGPGVFGNDIFEHFFTNAGMQGQPNIRIFQNGRPVQQKPVKPPPIKKTVEITLEQAFNGHNVLLEIERTIYNNKSPETEKISLPIRIPEGIDHDEVIVLADRGHISEHQLQGDVQLLVRIQKHELFTRKGPNLHCKRTITLKESLCGFCHDISHLNGKKLRVNTVAQNTITKHGYVKELPAYGMVRNGEKGTLFLEFEIIYPESFTNEQIEALSKIL